MRLRLLTKEHDRTCILPKVLNQSLIQPEILAANVQKHTGPHYERTISKIRCGQSFQSNDPIPQQINGKKKAGIGLGGGGLHRKRDLEDTSLCKWGWLTLKGLGLHSWLIELKARSNPYELRMGLLRRERTRGCECGWAHGVGRSFWGSFMVN